VDFETTAGVLISGIRPTSARTRIIDIAPTVLKFFGIAIPDDIDGQAIF
jgi:arylsulfatase A-like enzyme